MYQLGFPLSLPTNVTHSLCSFLLPGFIKSTKVGDEVTRAQTKPTPNINYLISIVGNDIIGFKVYHS